MTGWAAVRELAGILLGAAAALVAFVVFFYWPRAASSERAYRREVTAARIRAVGWILLLGILALALFACHRSTRLRRHHAYVAVPALARDRGARGPRTPADVAAQLAAAGERAGAGSD